MLTRIELDGFKSFEGFAVDLSPFSVIIGPNAAGKSNLFDAMRLLSRLVQTDVRSAMKDLRGEPHELFRASPGGSSAKRMRLAVEVLLDAEARDPYGQSKTLTTRRMRYELEIERRDDLNGLERIYVTNERATHISRSTDRLFRVYKSSKGLSEIAISARRKTPFLSVEAQGESGPELRIYQDGTQGRIRRLPAAEAEATALSTIRTATEFPHLFALREELASLRYLQLEPSAERNPSDLLASDRLEPNGSNIAAVLARIENETRNPDRPRGVIAELKADLAFLIPGVVDVRTERNEAAREYRLFVETKDGLNLSARLLSDGTLRILALLTLLYDPKRRGVICFEEPENGVHEARLTGLIEVLRSFCTDLSSGDESQQPLTQIVVNTHSPVVMKSLRDSEIFYADTVGALLNDTHSVGRKTRMRTGPEPMGDLVDRERTLTRYEIESNLKRDRDIAA